jgi:hypothetical protein
VLKWPDERRTESGCTPATYRSGGSTVSDGVCEQRYATERVLPQSGFELRHVESASEEATLEKKEEKSSLGRPIGGHPWQGLVQIQLSQSSGPERTPYHPSLQRRAAEWSDYDGALAMTTGTNLVGIYVLPSDIIEIALRCASNPSSLEELHACLSSTHSVQCEPVPEEKWQLVHTPEQRLAAEQKLDQCRLLRKRY